MRIKFGAIAIALLIAISANADDRFVRVDTKTMTFKGGRVSIDHSFGDVSVRTHPGPQLSYKATVRASDPNFGQKIVISATESATGITIRTIYPDSNGNHSSIRINGTTYSSYSVDLDVTMPETAPLTLRNKFGGTDVQGLRASSEIINAHGGVTLRDAH
ncbi:MAG TPA: hypothetical protein VJ032_05530, partial [Thermoanaerobaculia bacterium]|nr:hypothetical protein [Thermoanaerobaculia bacterium]